jgi:hypothetical protein
VKPLSKKDEYEESDFMYSFRHKSYVMYFIKRELFRIRINKAGVLILGFILSVFFVRAQSGVISKSDSYTSPLPDHTYELKGNLLLFEKYWAHGRVELPDHKILQNDSLFYNYDKMNQTLLVTKDFKTMLTVEKKNFRSVTFFVMDSVFILEHVDLINSRDVFFELLRDDNKYSLYKDILTEIRDVNYRSSGLEAEGNTNGTLLDHNIYYIVFRNKEYKKLNKIDKKSIQKVFSSSSDKDKVEKWLSGKGIDGGESLLWDLVAYLNN